jgi:2,4-dienoyl-CoA reductase-like NADH-dependent reductase (Old Yellow Enzyme family)/thioredoxin reductase
MLDLRNPFIFAPIKTGYSDDSGHVYQKHMRFYDLRSRHAGAVAVEPLYMDKGLREIPTQMGIDGADKIPGLSKLTGVIHRNGSRAIAHLNHPGRMVNPRLPGNYFVSATDKACENGGAEPRRMERSDMDTVIARFRDSAARAEEAGFDIIELQFGHGYLLAQFISPAVNDRTDEYGGSFENRIRFPMEVLDAVQQAVSLPVIVRLSGDEMTDEGIKVDQMVALSSRLKKRGVAAVHVSAGTVCSTPPWFFQHMFVPKGKTWDLAGRIKQETDIPVIFVGRINSREDIDTLVHEYQADYVAVGRGLVADHNLVGKYQGQVEGDIRPCLACTEGCLGGVKAGEGLRCVVNPLAGREDEEQFPEDPEALNVPAEQRNRYAVVGGGLAGMEAAITLSQKGHQVELFERESLGGQFNLASLPPNKDSLREIVRYLTRELDEEGVTVHRREADADLLANGGYDGVLLATGSRPAVPPIEGLSTYYWTEFLHDQQLPEGKKILIIGGGLIGMELASKLVDRDNRVIVVEMLPQVANGMEMIEKAMTMKKLSARDTTIYTNYRVRRVDGREVEIAGEAEGEELVLREIDHIVIAAGMRSNRELQERLQEKADGALPVYVIGDAREVGKAQTAIFDGYATAISL